MGGGALGDRGRESRVPSSNRAALASPLAHTSKGGELEEKDGKEGGGVGEVGRELESSLYTY